MAKVHRIIDELLPHMSVQDVLDQPAYTRLLPVDPGLL